MMMRHLAEISSPDPASVTIESWEGLFQNWHSMDNRLNWACIFTLPVFLKSWWDTFGQDGRPYICGVWKERRLIGMAPFVREGSAARVMGSPDLFDYTDFIVEEGQERYFFNTLFTHMRNEGIVSVHAGLMRPDSPACIALRAYPQGRGCRISLDPADRTYELLLPGTWEEYLRMLSGKERHEIQRKLRRLNRAGQITYHTVHEKEDVPSAVDTFIRLFRSSTTDKARFMDPARESFFRALASALAEARILRLSVLHIDNTPVASTMCFDYRSAVYIYNNGYNERYRSLSVGVLSKVLSIRQSIELGRKKYDFLKGDEPYKGRLGGAPVQLYDCRIELA